MGLSQVVMMAVLALLILVLLFSVTKSFHFTHGGRTIVRSRNGSFADEYGKAVLDSKLVEELENEYQEIMAQRRKEIPTFWPK